jgi:hypothetical protein
MVMRHAAISDLPAGVPPPSADDLKAVPPVGAAIVAIVAGGLGGAALGEGLYPESPGLAWLAWLGLCLMLYCVATIAGRRGARRWSLLTILGLGFGVLVSTMFVWGESVPRATSGLALGRNLLLLLSIVVLGAVTPIALVLVPLRHHLRRPADAARPSYSSLAPLAISVALGAASLGIGVAVILGTLFLVRDTDRSMQIAAVIAAASAAPILVWPIWVTAYEWLVARWRVDPPDGLRLALDTLYADAGATFTRVLCLAPSYGQGRIC